MERNEMIDEMADRIYKAAYNASVTYEAMEKDDSEYTRTEHEKALAVLEAYKSLARTFGLEEKYIKDAEEMADARRKLEIVTK